MSCATVTKYFHLHFLESISIYAYVCLIFQQRALPALKGGKTKTRGVLVFRGEIVGLPAMYKSLEQQNLFFNEQILHTRSLQHYQAVSVFLQNVSGWVVWLPQVIWAQFNVVFPTYDSLFIPLSNRLSFQQNFNRYHDWTLLSSNQLIYKIRISDAEHSP